jgi:hypothetical protein
MITEIAQIQNGAPWLDPITHRHLMSTETVVSRSDCIAQALLLHVYGNEELSQGGRNL